MKKLIVLLITLLILPNVALAAKGGTKPPPAPVCALTGVWAGNMEVVLFGDGPTLHLEWIGSHTSMDGLKGEMLLNWTYNNSSENPTYSFTWYSQITSDGWSGCTQYRGVRVSGTAQIDNCNEVIINYLFDMEYETTECELIWDNSPAEGTASEYRMPNIYTPPAAE